MKGKSVLLWVLSLVLVLGTAVYQRLTGPTYPARTSVSVDGQEMKFRLLRSYDGRDDAPVRLEVPDEAIAGTMRFRRFRSNDPWSEQALQRDGRFLVASIPHQPPAGKVMYQITLSKGESFSISLTEEPVIIRFRGAVPPWVLIPHVIFMFLAMLYSTRAGFGAIFREGGLYKLSVWTLVLLFLGGLLLGPIVQKLAFGAYWTGWPFGHDLTDNKTMVAAIFWALAVWRLRKNPDAGGWALAAAVILMAVYMIPHSVLGSELDFTKME